MAKYCNACISWRSRGIRPFGKCLLTGASVQDLHSCDEHLTEEEARAAVARWKILRGRIDKACEDPYEYLPPMDLRNDLDDLETMEAKYEFGETINRLAKSHTNNTQAILVVIKRLDDARVVLKQAQKEIAERYDGVDVIEHRDLGALVEDVRDKLSMVDYHLDPEVTRDLRAPTPDDCEACKLAHEYEAECMREMREKLTKIEVERDILKHEVETLRALKPRVPGGL